MRCLLIFAGALVSASAPLEDPRQKRADLLTSSGVVLLQRPSHTLSHVDLNDLNEQQSPPLSRQSAEEHPASHFGGQLAGLTELQPILDSNLGLLELKDLEHEAFSVLVSGEWSRWTPHHKAHKHSGVHAFLSSVVFFDWCLFASAIMVFLILHMLVLGRMEDRGWHCAVLMIWLTVGGVYNAVIWGRFGSNAGISWFAGYLLEFIFLIENIFIFHIVIQAFKTPAKMTRKALHIVVWGQIAFEMIFFMGLAAWLRSFKVLPYLLGVWLICCGFLAACGEPHFEAGEIMETSACRAFTTCLGDRLSPSYGKDGECLLRDSEGKMRVSLLGLVVAVLLAADFLLEIDVVLTKIEELPNPYIAFTSSAIAAFSIPDLFFVTKGMMKRFPTLKYGIGFVLVLFGTQMLLSSIYILRPIVACCIIVGVLAVCVLVSFLQTMCSGGDNNAGSAEAVLSEAGQTAHESTSEAAEEKSPVAEGKSPVAEDENGNPQESEAEKAHKK